MDRPPSSTDHELLQHFAATRNPASFEELVRRHGPMVLTLCRRRIGDVHLADDAFQTVFMLLMNKARTLKPWKPLAHWLYRAAVVEARSAKAKTYRRQRHEMPVAAIDQETMKEPSGSSEDDRSFQPIVDEEICRLPQKLSTPLFLCYVEGKNHEEAAKQLGCPKRTLTSRLEKARDLLRSRLMRRGVSAGALAALLANGNQAFAAVPEVLVATTVQKISLTASSSAVAGSVLALSTATKIAITGALAIAVGAVAVMPTLRSREPQRSGVFAVLPEADPAHLSKLRVLGDDSWLDLGAPAADPTWGHAFGRGFSPMTYAPDLDGAFLFGQYQLISVNERKRFVDDLWFYHAPSHRWICVHPGTTLDQPDIKLNEHGIESTLSGEPIPVATMMQAGCAMTYDSDRRQFVHMPQGEKGRLGPIADKVAAYQAEGPPLPKNPSPWFFDTVSGKWSRLETDSVGPQPSAAMADLLFYLPRKKLLVFERPDFGRNFLFTFDPAANRWAFTSDQVGKPDHEHIPPVITDPLAYYDAKRDRIDLIFNTGHYVFDTGSMSWRDAASSCPGGTGTTSTWTYDSLNDVGVLITYRHHDPELNGVWIYHPADNSWSKSPTSLPSFPFNSSAFYDPQLNIHFVYHASDRGSGSMWAYRYRDTVR